jgi:ribosomal-protein-alanine N-acetyltransferase
VNALLQPRPLKHRPMRLDDVDQVLAIEMAAYSFPWTRGNFIDSLAAGYLAELLEDTADTRPTAPPLGYFVAMAGVDELHLLNLTVAVEHQGQGHGRALLAAVQAHGRARGLSALWLEVRHSNERAQALYTRLGFVEVGRRRGYYPAPQGREDAIVMRLALGAPPAHGLD